MAQNILTQKNHVLSTGLDAGRLAQWRLIDGSSYAETRNIVVTRFNNLNQELFNAWSELFRITTEDHFEYEQGGSLDDFPILSDLDDPPYDVADVIGHMIDLQLRGKRIGGSGRYFRDARSSLIRATANKHVNSGRQTFEKNLLTRALTNTETALGSSGYDVPMVRGTGGNIDHIPPAFGGQVFTTSHNHFNGYNSDASANDFGDVLNGLAADVAEHGHNGNLVAYVAAADTATYRALGDSFIMPTAAAINIIDRGGATSGTTFFSDDQISGRMNTGMTEMGKFVSTQGIITLKSTYRIPTGYAFVFNAYGQNDERNALAVRIHPQVGFGFFIAEIPNFESDYPVKRIDVNTEYGISVNEGRTNGAAGYLVSGGAWANPTIV